MTETTAQALYQRRAQRVAYLLAWVPFIRLIGLSGSVGRGTAHRQSDIDFFIATHPGRLFTVRFLVTLLVQLVGLRRYGRHVAGRICLNRYHTTNDLEVRPHTQYHAVDLGSLKPLLDLDRTYRTYQDVNRWMTSQFGQPVDAQAAPQDIFVTASSFSRRGGEWLLRGRLGTTLESVLRRFQLRFRELNPTTQHLRTNIVVSDTQLLFHPFPQKDVS